MAEAREVTQEQAVVMAVTSPHLHFYLQMLMPAEVGTHIDLTNYMTFWPVTTSHGRLVTAVSDHMGGNS